MSSFKLYNGKTGFGRFYRGILKSERNCKDYCRNTKDCLSLFDRVWESHSAWFIQIELSADTFVFVVCKQAVNQCKIRLPRK